MGESHARHEWRTPLLLDASQSVWPVASADGIICINMVHISPWEATVGLIRGAAAILPPASSFYLYGPYMREGFATAPSNQSVRPEPSRSQPALGSAGPRGGCRDGAIRWILGSVITELPANNLSVIFRRM